MDRKKETRRNLCLLLLSLLISVLVCETVVRLVRPASDIFPADPASDPIMGIRLLPFQSGHDGQGFRNITAAGYFPIVCIGDSMIYGVGVARRYAIPQQLGRLLNQPVYNMGMGSYGPVQYYQLLINSRQMHPQTTIISFYLGNDLLDASEMVTTQDYWKGLAKDLGGDHHLKDIALCLTPPDDHIAKFVYQDPNIITIRLKRSGSLIWQVHSYLRLHSGLYSLMYEGWVKPLTQRFFEQREHRKRPGAFYTPQVDTIFTPGVNLSDMDPGDPKIRLGLLATQRVVEMMAQLQKSPQDKDSLRFIILPTKENVYYHYLKSQKVTLPPQYECAVHYEREITRWLRNLITANGFRFIDVFPRMEQAANQGALLYHASSDAHPNIAGNQLIAQILAEALQK